MHLIFLIVWLIKFCRFLMQQCYTGLCLIHYMLKVMLLTALQKGYGPYNLFTKIGYDSSIYSQCSAFLTSLCHAMLQTLKLLSSSCYFFFPFHKLVFGCKVGGNSSRCWNRGGASDSPFTSSWCCKGFTWITCHRMDCHWHSAAGTQYILILSGIMKCRPSYIFSQFSRYCRQTFVCSNIDRTT